jgi:hypothetical protein
MSSSQTPGSSAAALFPFFTANTGLHLQVMRRHLTASTKSVLKADASFEAVLEGER